MNLEWTKSYNVTTKDGNFRVFVAKHEEGFYAGCLYYKPGRAFHAPSNVKPFQFEYERRFALTEKEAFDDISKWVREQWGKVEIIPD
jgi:hypothetical protein